MGQYLELVEIALCEKFIPALLQVSEPVDNVFCQLLSHGVKMGGIAIKNLVTSAPHLYQCSMDASDILVNALHNGGGLNAEAHKAVVKVAGNAACKARLKVEEENLEGLKSSGGRKMAKHLGQMGKTGAWLSVIPNCFDRTECRRRNSKTTLQFATACALEAFLSAAMDAGSLSWLGMGSAARRVALQDSNMTTYVKNWHTCA